MPRLYTLALVALLPACGSTPPAPEAPAPPDGSASIATEDLPRRPTAADQASIVFPSHSRVWTASDSLYRPASETDGDRDAVLVRDLDELGETPVGMADDAVHLRYSTPHTDSVYTLGQDFPGGELRVEVFNTTRERQARGETVRVRELTWLLPNNWIRKVWLHDTPGGWVVADGVEWASDRLNF